MTTLTHHQVSCISGWPCWRQAELRDEPHQPTPDLVEPEPPGPDDPVALDLYMEQMSLQFEAELSNLI